MYCSVIMGDIFSLISLSDLNNLRTFNTTTNMYYVFKKRKAPKVSIEIKRIQVGMLREQGGNSR